jgi:hypothetical protein
MTIKKFKHKKGGDRDKSFIFSKIRSFRVFLRLKIMDENPKP